MVEELSPSYSGDLRPGDQLLHVPHHTAGATLSYNMRRTVLTAGMTYVGSWIDSDLLALYGYYFGGQPYRGSGRDYWMTYPSFAKFNLALSQSVTNRLSMFVRLDNLTNSHAFEVNNLATLAGRISVIGLRTKL